MLALQARSREVVPCDVTPSDNLNCYLIIQNVNILCNLAKRSIKDCKLKRWYFERTLKPQETPTKYLVLFHGYEALMLEHVRRGKNRSKVQEIKTMQNTWHH